MKTREIMISNINITFLIGENQKDNFDIIDLSNENENENDLWFHAEENTSCHVIAKIPEKIDKKLLNKIVKQGALLCKQNTKKISKLKDVEICYTTVNNIHKTEILGTVEISNCKIITV